ncbi:hypothetical protein CR513_16070, partial [Mucuna pruriens]
MKGGDTLSHLTKMGGKFLGELQWTLSNWNHFYIKIREGRREHANAWANLKRGAKIILFTSFTRKGPLQ